MCARERRRWNIQSRDALGVVVLTLLVIIIRTLFAPAPVQLPSPQSFIPEPPVYPEQTYSTPLPRPASGGSSSPTTYRDELFAFDPNTLDSAGFRKLGFSAAQTTSLLRYRTSGALFRRPEDFSRVYVVSEQMYQRLLPYIRIEAQPQQIPAQQAQPPVQRQTEPPQRSTTPVRSSQRELIEINGADTFQLQRIRGIGTYYAQKIVQYRGRLGGFVSAQQLMEIEGIDATRFEMMASQIEIDETLVRKIDLKTADQSTLGQHPYIGPYAARWIVHYREQLGDTVCTLPVLVRRNILKAEQARGLGGYVEW